MMRRSLQLKCIIRSQRTANPELFHDFSSYVFILLYPSQDLTCLMLEILQPRSYHFKTSRNMKLINRHPGVTVKNSYLFLIEENAYIVILKSAFVNNQKQYRPLKYFTFIYAYQLFFSDYILIIGQLKQSKDADLFNMQSTQVSVIFLSSLGAAHEIFVFLSACLFFVLETVRNNQLAHFHLLRCKWKPNLSYNCQGIQPTHWQLFTLEQ